MAESGNMEKIVLQKFIADSGHCSRRQATELIKAGKVKVNGRVAEPGLKVFINDEVRIGRKKIGPAAEKIYIIINKPEGYVCTNRSFKNEHNIFELLVSSGQELKQRLFVVGRLDKNSRGLVLLTNDGELAQRIAHPSFRHEKQYEVRISKLHTPIPKSRISEIIDNFTKGIKIDGKPVKAKRVQYLGDYRFSLVLTQGMKRQIRRMFAAVGLKVTDLKRTRIGCQGRGIELGGLKCGQWRKLSLSEIKKLV
jgi:23S rRNA pseudouridine2604 synthase